MTGEIPKDPRLIMQEGGVAGIFRAFWQRIRTGELGSIPIVIGLIVIWTTFQVQNDRFLSPENLYNLAVQISATGLIALGIVLVLLLGEIDLSVGSVSGLAAGVLAVINIKHGWNAALSIVIAIAVGGLIGLFQGVVFTRLHVPSFVVTLAGLIAWQGALLYVLGDTGTINFPFDGTVGDLTSKHFGPGVGWTLAVVAVAVYVGVLVNTRLQQVRAQLPPRPWAEIGLRSGIVAVILGLGVWELERARGVPLAFLIFIGFIIFFSLLTTQTRYGRHIFAVGGNEEAARRAGISVTGIRVSVFGIAGAMAALGGIMAASQVLAANQSSGSSDVLLNAIAAAVIGGTSLFGGRGSAWSALLGILVIGSITNGMFLLGLSSDIRLMITGGVLLAAAVIDALGRRGRVASGKA